MTAKLFIMRSLPGPMHARQSRGPGAEQPITHPFGKA